MKKVRVEKPFTNKFGQTIEVGKEVFVITTCTHRTRVTQGTYLGYIERQGYNRKSGEYEMMPYVQVKVHDTKGVAVYVDDGSKVVWGSLNYSRERKWIKVPYERIATLHYNNILPSYSTASELAAAVM